MSVIELKSRKRRRERRRRVKRGICILSIILVCLLIIGAGAGKDKVITGYEYKSTDTLWGLLKYCPEDMDRWEYLDLVMELNGMSDETVYSDRLYQVPIFKK